VDFLGGDYWTREFQVPSECFEGSPEDAGAWGSGNGVNSVPMSGLRDAPNFAFRQEIHNDNDGSQTVREPTFGDGSITSLLDKPELLPSHLQPYLTPPSNPLTPTCSRLNSIDGSETDSDEAMAQASPRKRAPSRTKRSAAKLGGKEQRRSKIPHKTVEKRYRTKMNSGFAALQACLPSLRSAEEQSSEEKNNGETTAKIRKATVLTTAAAHIKYLQNRLDQLRRESEEQKLRLAAYENLLITRVETLHDYT
jgi:hypothetical protein